MTKIVYFANFFPLTQIGYFLMIHLVIFSSTIMQKYTYVIIRLEVLVNKFAAYVELYVRSELYTAITTTTCLTILCLDKNYIIEIYFYFAIKRYKASHLDLEQLLYKKKIKPTFITLLWIKI